MAYDPHKKYTRVGKCRRCGRCCDLHCQYLRWIANRNIKAGEQFNDTGIDAPFMAICLLHDNLGERAKHYGGCCVDFPTSPAQTPEKCGYYWVEEN